MNKADKITVIGLGLLGGSYVQGLHAAGYTNVWGIDINQEAVDYAIAQQWIIDGSTNPETVQDSDLVISCLYPHAFIQWVKDNQDFFKPGSFLTDVTGVKQEVIRQIQEILRKDVEFVSAHPMAGREYKGISYADCSRFNNANFILVPSNNTEEGIETIRQLAQDLGFSRISELTPKEHDEMVGFLSQLTHIIAVSLMNMSDNTKLSAYTGDSFRDLTRIARINESLWPELFVMNKEVLTKDIDSFVQEMTEFRDLIQNEDYEAMRQKLIQSTERRAYFDKKG